MFQSASPTYTVSASANARRAEPPVRRSWSAPGSARATSASTNTTPTRSRPGASNETRPRRRMTIVNERASTASARPVPTLRDSAMQNRLPTRTRAGRPRHTAGADAASPAEVRSQGWQAVRAASPVAIAANARCRTLRLLALRTEDPIGRGRKAPGLPNGVGDATALADVRRELNARGAPWIDRERCRVHGHRERETVEAQHAPRVRTADDIGDGLRGAARWWAGLRPGPPDRHAAIAVDDADARAGRDHHRLA